MRVFARAADFGIVDDAVDVLTARYKAAFDEYQTVVNRNARAHLSGGGASVRSLVEEERAFEALDCARHALLTAAERAYPTIH